MVTAIDEAMKERILVVHPDDPKLKQHVERLATRELTAQTNRLLTRDYLEVKKVLLAGSLKEQVQELGDSREVSGVIVRTTGDGITRPDFARSGSAIPDMVGTGEAVKLHGDFIIKLMKDIKKQDFRSLMNKPVFFSRFVSLAVPLGFYAFVQNLYRHDAMNA